MGGGGYLTLTQPWPAMLRTLYKDPDRFKEVYWSRFSKPEENKWVYFAGDGAKRDEEGYFWLLGRVDDVMNVSGHRISTLEVESALVDHPAVAEAAVVGRADDTTGQAIAAFCTLKGTTVGDEKPHQGDPRPRRHQDRQDRPAGLDRLHARAARRPAPGRSCAAS